jgi:hypothetical protein
MMDWSRFVTMIPCSVFKFSHIHIRLSLEIDLNSWAKWSQL